MSQDNQFRPYGNKKDDATGPNAPTRRIDPAETRKDQSQNDDWRGMVGTGNYRESRTNRTAATRPTSNLANQQQRFLSWVQNGGVKYLAIGGVVVVVLLLVLLTLNKSGRQDASVPTSLPANSNLNINNQPTAAIVIGTQAPAQVTDPNQQVPAQPATQGQQLAVSGTGTEGLFLRDAPGGNIVKTMPEGTKVEKIAEQDFNGLLWYNIREVATGTEGWSASTYLAPAQ